MKSPRVLFRSLICCCLFALPLGAADPVPQPSVTSTDPVQIETALISRIHATALADTDVDGLLSSGSPFPDIVAPSVLLARRTMAVCGWLQSDNEYGRAMKLAQRSLARLASMQETNDADRAERLYWEALLEGWVLDQKTKAIATLEAAQKLKPDDDRLVELEHELAAAVAEFGR